MLARTPRTMPIERALKKARKQYWMHDTHPYRHSSGFWKTVFTFVYGTEPLGDCDLRWDDLFKQGYPALRKLNKEE